MKQRFFPVAMTALTLSLALAACGETADEDTSTAMAEPAGEPDAIAQRQALLEGMGDAFRDLRGQLEESSPDFAVITASADTIRGNAGQFIDFFPAGTGIDSGADTEALPIIWEDPEGFAAAHQRLLGAADGMVEAAGSGDVALVEAAVGDLGGACKNCHDTYRLDD